MSGYVNRCSNILHQGETGEGSHNTREGDSPLSLIGGGGSSSFLPFSFVVVSALLLLSSTFSLACTFCSGRFSLLILSHSLVMVVSTM